MAGRDTLEPAECLLGYAQAWPMLWLLFQSPPRCHQCWFTLGNSSSYQTNESSTFLPGAFACETGGLPEAAASQLPSMHTVPQAWLCSLIPQWGGKKGEGALLHRESRSSLRFSALWFSLPTLVLISSVLKKTWSLGAT